LRVANVQDGHLDLSEVKLIQVARSDIERYRLHAGDVVLTEGGDLDPNEKPEKILKPLFDQIWNGFGWPGSVNYGASGERKNKK